MSPPESETKRLECPGCGDQFRIRPREGRELPPAVPCPTCETDIPTEQRSREGFWVSKSRAEIFDREAVPEPGGRETPEEPVRPPEADTAKSPAGSRQSTERTFRGVSEVRGEGRGVLPDDDSSGSSRSGAPDDSDQPRDDGEQPAGEEPESPSAEAASLESESSEAPDDAPFEEYEREPPDANLEAIEQDLELVAADRADDARGTPLPSPVRRQEQGADPGELAPEGEEVDGESDSAAPAETSDEGRADDGAEPRPASELATRHFSEWERELTGEVEDHQYDVRVHDTVREDIGVRAIVDMLERGVWTGAVEIREDDQWVPLPEHRLLEKLRGDLVGQSRQILLRTEPSEDENDRREAAGDGESGDLEVGAAPESPEETGASGPGESESGAPGAEPPPPPADAVSEESASEERPPPEGDDVESGREPDTAEVEPVEREGESEEEAARDASAAETADARRTVIAGAAVVLAFGAMVLAAMAFLRSRSGEEDASSESTASVVGEAAGSDAETMASSEDAAATGGVSPVETAVREARRTVRKARSSRARARAYLDAELYGPARRQAIRSMTERGLRPEIREIYDRSIRRDESLRPPTETVGEDVDIRAIHALGGGWSVSFRMVGAGDEQYAFKPAQKHWERGWRAEIAAYHLCEIITCHFEVPRNRPVRIRRDRFRRLYGRIDNEDQRAYREKFEKLVWVEEEGPDGREHEYLYGTLKDWVPEFVKWPIEYQSLWEPWLNGDYSRRNLEKPLEETLEPLQDKGPVDFYDRILGERGDATTRSMAKGVSSILTFDYLTTNWDRFSTAENFYGVNNQFADGRFVSIDNGAAFSRHRFDSVERRLLPVTRFSESMVTSIRAMRPEVVEPVLFPDPTEEERDRLSIFWEQRDRYLDRINRLIAKHGEREIFVFR